MWLPRVGDSACNQAPAYNHLLSSFSFAISQRDRAATRAVSSRTQGERLGMREDDRKGCCAIRVPRGFPLQCRQRHIPGSCLMAKLSTIHKLWVTVPDKRPSSNPIPTERYVSLLCRHAGPNHNVCVGVCVPFMPH